MGALEPPGQSISCLPNSDSEGSIERSKNVGQSPGVSLRLQIKFCEFLEGMGDEMESEELGGGFLT